MMKLVPDMTKLPNWQNWKLYNMRLVADDEERLFELANDGSLDILNPARDFAIKMRDGFFEHAQEDYIVAVAEIVNELAELWKEPGSDELVPQLNIFRILANLTQRYILLFLKYQELTGEEECEENE